MNRITEVATVKLSEQEHLVHELSEKVNEAMCHLDNKVNYAADYLSEQIHDSK